METKFGHEHYEPYNAVSARGGSVLFGATFAADLPLCELAQGLDLDQPLYNRSIRGLTVDQARDHLKECVIDLAPDKVFINIGDVDLEREDFSLERFLSEYEWLLYQIHGAVRGVRLYLVAVCSPDPRTAALNQSLRKLAARTGCGFLKVSGGDCREDEEIRMFHAMRTFLRRNTVTFAEAMEI